MKNYMVNPEKQRKRFKICYPTIIVGAVVLFMFLFLYFYFDYKDKGFINYSAVALWSVVIACYILLLVLLLNMRRREVFKYVLFDNEYVSKCDGKGKLIFKYNISDVTAVQRVIVDGNEAIALGAWNYVYNDYICVIFNDNVLFPRRVGHLGFNTLGRPNKVYTEYELKIAQHETYNRRNVELPPLKHPLSSYGKEITTHVDNFVFFTYTDDIWQEMIEMFGDKVIE